MRMHQVEVDDAVYSFVRAHAEPLEDTFNTALRRLLPLQGAAAENRAKSTKIARHPCRGSEIPSFPGGTPMALRQILAVVWLVCAHAYSRTAATQFVANQFGVAPQTVLDKYCRQLQLKAGEFDRLLEQQGITELGRILRSKFPSHHEVVDDVLKSCT